ncbi:pilus assembly protein PilP [Undibacterium sp. TC4M20W]|uniref:pilus assembly protein PilP n=1 Tax=Undibacterium sp. TC4M20W TaxID=3413052 RepID=UPI003BF0D0C4
MVDKIEKNVSMNRAFLFCILLVLQISAYGKPVWYPPVFLDVPPGWHVQKNRSPDSQAFSLRKGLQLITFDYGLRVSDHQLDCEISDMSVMITLDDLKCISSERHHQKIKRKISIKDPKDEANFKLIIFTISGLSEADNRELVSLLKSLRFVGSIENLKLVSVDSRKRQATIVDESGIARIVRKNDFIARNFGNVREIKSDHLLIEEWEPDARGEYKPKQIELHLSR